MVDNSCNIPSEECEARQDGISELLATIKQTDSDRRVAYFEFTAFVNFLVELDDPFFNNQNGNQQSIIYEYAKLIKTDSSLCAPYPFDSSSINLKNAVASTLGHLQDKYIDNRHKKIVLINECNDPYLQDACNQDLIVNGDPVEVTVINIGVTKSNITDLTSYGKCFTLDKDDIIAIPDTSSQSFTDAADPFINSICDANTMPTSQPTSDPTTSAMPTASPTTDEPSSHPTTTSDPTTSAMPTASPTDVTANPTISFKPTFRPSRNPSTAPTPYPLQDNICVRDDLDIIFLVDNSCLVGLLKECQDRQDGISELLASIKQKTSPRVGYIEFDSFTSNVVRLDDEYYNDLNNTNNIVIMDYASEIRNLECSRIGNIQSTDLYSAVNDVLDEFKRVQNSKRRNKKVVLFNNCNSEEMRFVQEACNISRIAHGESVEFTVVNIGVSIGNINLYNHSECLNGNGPDRLITIPDVKSKSFVDAIPEFVDAICYTESPTANPITQQPSLSPTPTLSICHA